MRFASCTGKIEISGIRKCFEGAAPGSVNLGLGQPDFDTPEHIKRAAIEAINERILRLHTQLRNAPAAHCIG